MNEEQLYPPRRPGETAQYEDDPFGLGDIDVTKLKIVSKDFLPRPEALVFKEPKPDAKKVTMVLDTFTIETFKEKADELGGSYQAMMRKLLFEYARVLKAEDYNLTGNTVSKLVSPMNQHAEN